LYRYLFGKSYVEKSLTNFGERRHKVNHVSYNPLYPLFSPIFM